MANGLLSELIQKYLLSEDKINLKKAYLIALSMELLTQIQAISKKIQLKNVHMNHHKEKWSMHECYHCSEPGHTSDQCYFKKIVEPVFREVT